MHIENEVKEVIVLHKIENNIEEMHVFKEITVNDQSDQVQTTTLDYYEKNGDLFAQDVDDVNFSKMHLRFISKLSKHAKILDLGCGSGRDSLAFLNAGFDVKAIDGSKKMCEIAQSKTGLSIRNIRFGQLDDQNKYDGVWACASLLHLPKNELPKVFSKIIEALKEEGIFYSSFKYGSFEGYRNGRYFTDFTESSMNELLEQFPELKCIESWISSDVRPGRMEQKWLNIIVQKQTKS